MASPTYKIFFSLEHFVDYISVKVHHRQTCNYLKVSALVLVLLPCSLSTTWGALKVASIYEKTTSTPIMIIKQMVSQTLYQS